MSEPAPPDPWSVLRRHTAARIGLGRAGDAVPTPRLLEFELAHARARDAVHAAVDLAELTTGLGDLETIIVHSAASDRATYLPGGLGYRAAAHKLVLLMTEARRLGLTGVALKDDAPALTDG